MEVLGSVCHLETVLSRKDVAKAALNRPYATQYFRSQPQIATHVRWLSFFQRTYHIWISDKIKPLEECIRSMINLHKADFRAAGPTTLPIIPTLHQDVSLCDCLHKYSLSYENVDHNTPPCEPTPPPPPPSPPPPPPPMWTWYNNIRYTNTYTLYVCPNRPQFRSSHYNLNQPQLEANLY